MATEFEITARWKKATAFAAHLYANGFGYAEIYRLTPHDWRTLADRLQQKHPSGKTIDVISEVIKIIQAAVAQKIAEEKEQQTA